MSNLSQIKSHDRNLDSRELSEQQEMRTWIQDGIALLSDESRVELVEFLRINFCFVCGKKGCPSFTCDCWV